MGTAAVAGFSPSHRPVLRAETLAALGPSPGAVLLDGTVGMGGHAAAWLAATAPDGRVIGLDRDPSALARARANLAAFGPRAALFHADYRDAAAVLDEHGLPRPDAVLLDLGLGSHQVDDPARGFSFRFDDAPLDMRFDAETPGQTAADILNHAPEPELYRIFHEYGEEPGARKLARVIVETRRRTPFRTVGDLVGVIRATFPPRAARRIDPSTLAFQALRIAVNRELEALSDAIEALVRLLPRGGRIAILAFHSIEDRAVKQALRRLAQPCRCRRGDPCTCGALQLLALEERRAVKTSEEEAVENPRARSARLRWGVRL